ncbi:hypothetical protein SESBI_39796 [Sesbania bispinosa]|nr:hypothetical protein SESBI_39796 [Sesbania bispinosa]
MNLLSVRQIKVKDICNGIGYWIIKVKVVRIWAGHDPNNLGQVLSIEMVLMDSEVGVVHSLLFIPFRGNKIQGTIPKDIFPSRSFDIKKGGFYKIGRAVVVNNDIVQETTRHPFRLVFLGNTFVKHWEPRGFTSIGLIKPFTAAQIRTYDNDLQHYIDTVGLCTSISSERAHVIDGRVVKMVLLELTDQTGRLECVLYDHYVDQIHDFFRSNGISNPVVVQFAKMMPFNPALFGAMLYFSHFKGYYYRYNVKVELFDGVHSTNVLLNDYHVLDVLNYLTTKPSRSDESIDAFQCMIGQKFLFIVKKSCCHQATHDECFKAIRFCADPEILRIFDEGDLYSLSIWNKVVITTGLKKFAPSDDSFFFSDKTFDTTYSFFRYVFQRSRDCESSSSSVTVPREISTTLDI